MKYTIFLLLILTSATSFSQKNYVEGFIILKNQKDTLKGKIDDQNWSINPTKVNFINIENTLLTYEIGSLKSFGVKNQESYIIDKVDLDVTPVQSSELLRENRLIIKKDTLLALLVYLQSENSLLYFKDKQSKEHFFYKNDIQISELINQKFLLKRGDKFFEYNNKVYQKQLDSLFTTCTKTIQTNSITYDKNSIVDKFIEYNDCIGCNYSCYFKKKDDNNILTIGFTTGINFEGKTLFHKDYFENVDLKNKYASPSFLVGINASIALKRNLNRNSILFETYYFNDNVQNQFKDYNASFSYLNFTTLIRRQFGSYKSFYPFFGAGANIKFLLSSQKALFEVDKISPHLVLELGAKRGNILISTRLKSGPAGKNDIIYEYRKAAEVIDEIKYNKVTFQFSLTYVFYNRNKSF
ncbi:MAG: hypothetical protein V4683_13695 [Bacteroidota bacterium]